MPPERDSELLSKIDLLIELARRQDESTRQLDSRVRVLEREIAEFRGEVRGRLDEMSNRIGDVNARLPVPIAYAPPNKPAA
ncbi:hypothetical protein [Azospirillum sp. sgz302134]